MRVLFIAFDSGELSVRLASALAEEVEDLCLMLAKQAAAPHLRLLSSRVNFHPFYRPRLRDVFQQLRLMVRLIRYIRRYNPDVIHLQKSHLWFSLALPLLQHYPLVISIHDPRDHTGDQFSRRTPQTIKDFGYRRADRVIAHNEQMKQVIIEELGISEEIIHIVPLVERGDPTLQPDVAEEDNLVLFFGRIWEYKGLAYFIKAEPLVTKQIPEARFVIAGRGDDFAPYERMMINRENFIVHNEFVSYEKRAELFRRASVVVLPYIEATQSGVIPVAYSHGKPVIATRVGGLPAQMEDGQTGFLVPPRDEKALADKIIRLLRDKTLRRRLGANARRKLETEWSAEAVAKKTIPVYEAAIRGVSQNCAQKVESDVNRVKPVHVARSFFTGDNTRGAHHDE